MGLQEDSKFMAHISKMKLFTYNEKMCTFHDYLFYLYYYLLLTFFNSVGHTRKISIPNCVEFYMTTNACRGFCESWAVPSSPKTTPSQPVTSIGQCCNIMETEPAEVKVLCVDGIRTLTFKSAVSCSCYHCKKD